MVGRKFLQKLESTLITNEQWIFLFYFIQNKFCNVLTKSISIMNSFNLYTNMQFNGLPSGHL